MNVVITTARYKYPLWKILSYQKITFLLVAMKYIFSKKSSHNYIVVQMQAHMWFMSSVYVSILVNIVIDKDQSQAFRFT